MLAMAASAVGAVTGLALGVLLSVVVALGDARKRRAGERERRAFTGSLVLVPLLLTGLGALAGVVVAALG